MAHKEYSEMELSDPFCQMVPYMCPVAATLIPDARPGDPGKLVIYHDHIRMRTYVDTHGGFQNEGIHWCEGIITVEEALADYRDEG